MKSTEKRRGEVVRLIHPTPGRRINGREAGREGIQRKRRGASKKKERKKKKSAFGTHFANSCILFSYIQASQAFFFFFRLYISVAEQPLLARQARESGCRPSHADPEPWGLGERKISSRPSALCSWTNGLLSQVDGSRENTHTVQCRRETLLSLPSVSDPMFSLVKKEKTSDWSVYERY